MTEQPFRLDFRLLQCAFDEFQHLNFVKGSILTSYRMGVFFSRRVAFNDVSLAPRGPYKDSISSPSSLIGFPFCEGAGLGSYGRYQG